MALIQNLTLTITRTDFPGTSMITVSYNAILNDSERNFTGLNYREKIEIWGADSGWCAPDDFLTSRNSSFTVESDGVVVRNTSFPMSNSDLDEDGTLCGQTDEIYAKVIITPELPTGASAKSNQINRNF